MDDRSPDAFLIGSRWVAPSSDARHEIIGPADEQRLGSVPCATPDDVNRAVWTAKDAFDRGDWARSSVADRAHALRQVLAQCHKAVDEIAEIAALELGQPVAQTRARTGVALSVFADAIESGLELVTSELRPDRATENAALITRHPAGVVGAITAFNAPFSFAASKSIRALMAGCSVVVKPALEGSLQTFLLADAFAEVGLPDGIISILPGAAPSGQCLVEHPDVDLITFTGSTGAGRRIAAVCGQHLKRTVLELGGKSAAVVLDDADLDAALPWLAGGAFGNAGQVCIALTRVLAPRTRYDEVVRRLADAAEALRPGQPLDPQTTLGALISASQRDRVSEHVNSARQDGATIVTGGDRPPGCSQGWFFAPTVLADVNNDMRVAREEIFGPVVVVIPHDGDDHAVGIANDSPYGLHGAVFSGDVDRALGVAGRIRSGTVAVNGYGILSSAPFGGVKCSGWGREGGPESIAEFTELRTLTLDASAANHCSAAAATGSSSPVSTHH
jgi:acyl-CoA reductase-like NAD-dependent aldehyde dehydrogenase